MKTRPPSWDDLRFLLAVHRDRSFFAAGKSLGVAASTVARRVEAVERRLGRVLVHRSNDGAQLDSDALPLVALAEELEFGPPGERPTSASASCVPRRLRSFPR